MSKEKKFQTKNKYKDSEALPGQAENRQLEIVAWVCRAIMGGNAFPCPVHRPKSPLSWSCSLHFYTATIHCTDACWNSTGPCPRVVVVFVPLVLLGILFFLSNSTLRSSFQLSNFYLNYKNTDLFWLFISWHDGAKVKISDPRTPTAHCKSNESSVIPIFYFTNNQIEQSIFLLLSNITLIKLNANFCGLCSDKCLFPLT